MSRNDAVDFAQRLYARLPGNYRAYDQEQGLPMLALVTVIAEQIAYLRQDLDDLWDNFFIETCRDWVVPYIGALVGANLLANPVARSNRLEVRDTVAWRRSKGTPEMLRAVAAETSGWPVDFKEFFRNLAWAQNVNHVRLERVLTPDLRATYPLSLLGQAQDPFAHAADIRPSADLDQARLEQRSLGIGRAAWATPGRYQIKTLGFFVRRLQTFPLAGATPAASDPGIGPPGSASWFTFNPLDREQPLFVQETAMPLSRPAFNEAPWQYFGKDVSVRQAGILLAAASQPQGPDAISSSNPFTFGGISGSLALDTTQGIRLIEPHAFDRGAAHFIIEALWVGAGSSVNLGAMSTLLARLDDPRRFVAGTTAGFGGQLALTVQTGRAAFGWSIPSSPPARFPGAVVAIRAAVAGAPRVADALYAYLPPAFLAPSDTVAWYIADDGTSYAAPNPASLGVVSDLSSLPRVRQSDGQVYPAITATQSDVPALAFRWINRMPGAMRVADPSRVAGVGLFIQAELFTGVFQPQGALVTEPVSGAVSAYPLLEVPGDNWPAFTFAPAYAALSTNLPPAGILAILVQPLSGSFVPSFELIIANRRGETLLAYLPEISNCPPSGRHLFVADDGSTWLAPTTLQQVPASLGGFTNARPATGQSLPIPGDWPLRYRRPVALDLCRPERSALLRPGELGIDPELGRFAFAPLDPVIGQSGFSVDYVEAFGGPVGALNFDRQLDPGALATRFVSSSGDADSPLVANIQGAPVHTSVAAAIAAAADGDVIEILDSATYPSSGPIILNDGTVTRLTIRAAAGQRPCLTSYLDSGVPSDANLRIAVAMASLELNGLLLSGGPLVVEQTIGNLRVVACTLDPRSGDALLAFDFNLNDRTSYLLCRCIARGLRVGPGVSQLTVADSIIESLHGLAIGGLAGVVSSPVIGSPPITSSPPRCLPLAATPSAPSVQLERVTVMGRIHCDVLVASESLLDQLALVADRQSGCIRFSRFELGSTLPRRYECVPSEEQAATCTSSAGCFAPIFNSRRYGRPDFGQLAAACPPEILTASTQSSEIGAFTSVLNTIRLANLKSKLEEFMPVGLAPIIVATT